MSVFLDNSQNRKLYFRGAAAFFIFAIFGSILVFLFGLSFTAAERTPISYSNASERYHYYYSAANDKKVALTIDDGPNAPATEKFLDVLDQYRVPATFFVVGEHVFGRPDLVKEISDRGYDVEVHSFTHAQSAHDSYQRLALEVHSTSYLISQITGKRPELYRPPFLLGIGIDPTLNPYIEPAKDVLWSLETGYLPVGADIDPRDWLATSTPEIVAGLTKALKNSPNGHIILLHEDVAMAKALGEVVTYLHDNGYTIVPLQELLTPPTSVALAATLRPGDTDVKTAGAVSKLQWFLYKEKYLDPYELSGVFDEQTRSALIDFQIKNNLVNPADPSARVLGIAEASTRALIEKISNAEAYSTTDVLVQSEGPIKHAAALFAAGMRALYVSVFPVVYMGLRGMVFLTLLLVVGRTLGIISLLILARFRKVTTPQVQTSGYPGVSVLIPAYNEEQNIAATLESIIRSTYPLREIIVIDDGSKDNTANEVRGIISAYPNDNVRLIQVQNGGKARALNIGIEQAQYEVIVVLDADAVLEKDALWHFTKHFVDKNVGAVAGRVCTAGSSSMLDLFQTLEYAVGQNIDKAAFSTIGAVGVVPGPAGAWRTARLRELGGFSTDTLAEDQDMTLTILRSGNRIVYEPLAIAYTETPHSIKDFLKQRFRWVYGTMQCFWKHKGAYGETNHGSAMTLVVLPNIFIFNIVLPLVYPFADAAFLFGLFLGQWHTLVLPFLAFTAFDIAYVVWGVWKEPHAWRLVLAVPLQRIVYRQLLYYSVMKSFVRAIEGTGSSWNKFTKMGDTKRFFFTSIVVPVPSTFMPSTPMERQSSQESQKDLSSAVSLSVTPTQSPYESR